MITDIRLVNETGKYNQSIVNLYCDEFCGIVYENRIRESVDEGSEIGSADRCVEEGRVREDFLGCN